MAVAVFVAVVLAAADLRAALLLEAAALVGAELDDVDLDAADLAVVVLRAEPDVLNFVELVLPVLEPADFVVVDLLAAVLVADFLAGVDFFAAVCVLAALLPDEAALAAVFFAADVVVPVRDPAAGLGSFFAPETTAFKSAPGLNFGTAFFLARIRSPVWGLRTMRAGRTTFSKAPKPVIATFSPFVTSLVTVSRTASSACEAAFLLPSK